jgi:hypothetical protein
LKKSRYAVVVSVEVLEMPAACNHAASCEAKAAMGEVAAALTAGLVTAVVAGFATAPDGVATALTDGLVTVLTVEPWTALDAVVAAPALLAVDILPPSLSPCPWPWPW